MIAFKMRAPVACAFVLVAAAIFPSRAAADTIVFSGPLSTTLAAFLSQTGAVNVVNGNFPNIGLVNDGVLDGTGEPYSGVADFTFLPPSSQLYSGTAGLTFSDWSTVLSGPELALSNTERLLASMPSTIYSMGFEFIDPSAPGLPPDTCNTASCIDSAFQVTLLNGSTPVGSHAFDPDYNQPWFFGVWTDQPFTALDIVETVGGPENEYFNRFYAGTTPVPEPASMLLVGVGLIAAVRRRMK